MTSEFPSQQSIKGLPLTIVQYSFFTIQYSMLAHAPAYSPRKIAPIPARMQVYAHPWPTPQTSRPVRVC